MIRIVTPDSGCDSGLVDLQAVGASFRIFDLLDRQPEVPVDGGLSSDSMNGGKIQLQCFYFVFPNINLTCC